MPAEIVDPVSSEHPQIDVMWRLLFFSTNYKFIKSLLFIMIMLF